VRLKPKPRTEEVEEIRGLSSKQLTERCPDLRKVFPVSPCCNFACEWSINEPAYMNCSFVASETGAQHSLEEIGKMMGLTREGVRVIELRALAKARLALRDPGASTDRDHDHDLHEPRLVSGARRLCAHDQVPELEDEGDVIFPVRRRKLG
jgi:hypothetical protein